MLSVKFQTPGLLPASLYINLPFASLALISMQLRLPSVMRSELFMVSDAIPSVTVTSMIFVPFIWKAMVFILLSLTVAVTVVVVSPMLTSETVRRFDVL